jgi:hypothetical protein
MTYLLSVSCSSAAAPASVSCVVVRTQPPRNSAPIETLPITIETTAGVLLIVAAASRARQLPAAGGAVLHPRRQPDELRRHHQPHLRLRGGDLRLDARRPCACEQLWLEFGPGPIAVSSSPRLAVGSMPTVISTITVEIGPAILETDCDFRRISTQVASMQRASVDKACRSAVRSTAQRRRGRKSRYGPRS